MSSSSAAYGNNADATFADREKEKEERKERERRRLQKEERSAPTSPGGGGHGQLQGAPEGKTNLYTECGRHGDDWLFGGFSLGSAVRRILAPKTGKSI